MHVKRVARKAALCSGAALAVVLSCAATNKAAAQSTPAQITRVPSFPSVDENGVDLTTGTFFVPHLDASVGPAGAGGLERIFLGGEGTDNLAAKVTTYTRSDGTTVYAVLIAGKSYEFTQILRTNIYQEVVKSGRSLSYDFNTNRYTFVDKDGSVLTTTSGSYNADTITRPNGEVIHYYYDGRLRAVTNNYGYMIKYEYAGPVSSANANQLTKVTAINLALKNTSCDPFSDTCDSTNWSYSTYNSDVVNGSGSITITDALGRATVYVYQDGVIRHMILPSGLTTDIDYDSTGRVARVVHNGGTWNYAWLPTYVGGVATNDTTVTVTGPNGVAYSVVVDHITGQIRSVTDGLNRQTTYNINSSTGYTDSVTYPLGNSVSFVRNDRGDVREVHIKPKAGSSLPERVITLSYDPNCSPATCSKPVEMVDGAAVTDFTYDGSTGQISTITKPADQQGKRAVSSFHYKQLSADYSSPNVAGPTPIWVPDTSSRCKTKETCTDGDKDFIQTSYGYGGPINNLQPTSVTIRDGASEQVSTTSFIWNKYGDVKNTEGPAAGSSTRWRYDNMRDLVGIVYADPDSPGSGRPSLVDRYFYAADGQLSSVQHGYVPSDSDDDWVSHITNVWSEDRIYDQGRLSRTVVRDLSSGQGAAQQVTDYSYRLDNRLLCVAQRVDPPTSASPTDACTRGQSGGTYDRVTRYDYSGAGELTMVTQGYQTSDARSVKYEYDPSSGLPSALVDGGNNRTTLSYDDFGRLSAIYYPDPKNGAVSLASNYEAFSYDSHWNINQKRMRNGFLLYYTWDNLDRRIASNDPNTSSFTYDNFDRMASATLGNDTLTLGYDALGDLVTESGWFGTVNAKFDAAGRRTHLTWPDGFNVGYNYDPAGELTSIEDSNKNALITLSYDNMGRRQTINRPNGVATSYTVDAIGRLTQINHDLPGDANDVSIGLGYNYFGEIASRTITSSNASYKWNGAKSSHVYSINGMNQVQTVDQTVLNYGTNGNMTNDGETSYIYDRSGNLTNAGSATFTFDPVGRMEQVQNGPTTKFLYSGTDLIGDYDTSGNLGRHYIPGPDIDEPLVWFEGGGSTDRRWFYADERGSVIGVADNSGNPLQINSYDEYGQPGPNNNWRFQYTAQMHFSGLPVYHFKHRAYYPALGRFMQTDPAGYQAGPNLYAYVFDDPVNSLDPYGEVPGDLIVTAPPRVPQILPADFSIPDAYFLNPDSLGAAGDWALVAANGYNGGWNAMFKSASNKKPQNRAAACRGGRVNYSYGAGGTVALFLGLNLNVSFTLSVPLHLNSDNPLQGVQYGFSGQVAAMMGLGGFVGGGEQGGVGYSKGPLTSGGGLSLYGEADAGAGGAVGASGQANFGPKGSITGGAGGVAGKGGAGFGLYAGGGGAANASWASRPAGC